MQRRFNLCAGSFVVLLSVGTFGPQSQAETPDKGLQARQDAAPVSDIPDIATESVAICMEAWDRATHMTKDDWRRTCIRMKKERESLATGQ